MLLLPPVHRVILQHLLDLLFQVTRSPDNKMDSHNLSLIFAPTLFLAVRSVSILWSLALALALALASLLCIVLALSYFFQPFFHSISPQESLSADDFGKLSQLLAYMIDNCEDIFEVLKH